MSALLAKVVNSSVGHGTPVPLDTLVTQATHLSACDDIYYAFLDSGFEKYAGHFNQARAVQLQADGVVKLCVRVLKSETGSGVIFGYELNEEYYGWDSIKFDEVITEPKNYETVIKVKKGDILRLALNGFAEGDVETTFENAFLKTRPVAHGAVIEV